MKWKSQQNVSNSNIHRPPCFSVLLSDPGRLSWRGGGRSAGLRIPRRGVCDYMCHSVESVCVCMRVCVCVCTCVRACVSVCLCVLARVEVGACNHPQRLVLCDRRQSC